jgi:hypothetical protein
MKEFIPDPGWLAKELNRPEVKVVQAALLAQRDRDAICAEFGSYARSMSYEIQRLRGRLKVLEEANDAYRFGVVIRSDY